MIDPAHHALDPEGALEKVTDDDIRSLQSNHYLPDGSSHVVLVITRLLDLLSIYRRNLADAQKRIKQLEDEVLVWKSEV